MHSTQEAILQAFQTAGGKELSTSALLESVYTEDIKRISQQIQMGGITAGTRQKLLDIKAKLHRRLTYHVKQLEQEGLLECTKILAKGEKCYTPKVKEGQEIVIKSGPKTLVLSRPATPHVPMEQYEQSGYVHRVLAQDWSSRMNALLVECRLFESIDGLSDTVQALMHHTNDVITLHHAEYLVQNFYLKEVYEILESFHKQFTAYGKRIHLSFVLKNIEKDGQVHRLIKRICTQNYANFTISFTVGSRELLLQSDELAELVETLREHGKKLNLVNAEATKQPVLIGKAGPYTFSSVDWNKFIDENDTCRYAVVSCGLTSVVVDIHGFLTKYGSAKALIDCMQHIAKSLFISNAQLRAKVEESFEELDKVTPFQKVSLFELSKNYIRLWNAQPSTAEDLHQRAVLIKQIDQSIQSYARTQEIIYFSCGMPLRFSISLSTAYRRFDEEQRLNPLHDFITIKRTEDLLEEGNKNLLLFYEQLALQTNNATELRIQRSGVFTPLDVLREAAMIATGFQIPLICIEFTRQTGSVTSLKSFIEGET